MEWAATLRYKGSEYREGWENRAIFASYRPQKEKCIE